MTLLPPDENLRSPIHRINPLKHEDSETDPNSQQERIADLSAQRIDTRTEEDIIKDYLINKTWTIHTQWTSSGGVIISQDNTPEHAQELKDEIEEFRSQKSAVTTEPFFNKVMKKLKDIFMGPTTTTISFEGLIRKVCKVAQDFPPSQTTFTSDQIEMRKKYYPPKEPAIRTIQEVAGLIISGLQTLQQKERVSTQPPSPLIGRVDDSSDSSPKIQEVATTFFTDPTIHIWRRS